MREKPIIYFDWDGTLADSMDLCVAELTETFRRMGLEQLPPEKYKLCNGPTNEESIPMMGIPEGRGEEYLRLRKEVGYELVPTHQKLFPGIRELLHGLKEKAELVIVSNGNGPYIHRSAEACGIGDCFTRVQASVPGKTKGQLLAGLLEEQRPEKAVMVGDRKGDILAGKENNLPTLCACFGFGTSEEWALADRQAATVEDMGRLLNEWLDN